MQVTRTLKCKLQRAGMLLLAALFTSTTSWAQFSGGSGTEADPYLISSDADWNRLPTM